jgi:DNA-directed RNA polymerase subunit M/transcription elongation factor TFIIS
MEPDTRRRCFKALLRYSNDLHMCREVEARAHAISSTHNEYTNHISRACFNMNANKSLNDASMVVHESDHVLAKGTNLERIENEANARKERFQKMLHEKYEALNDKTYEAIVKCRKCGSAEISWEEKQTRSADEAATLFCVCTKCKHRWVMS